jgi:hypothetical protein
VRHIREMPTYGPNGGILTLEKPGWRFTDVLSAAGPTAARPAIDQRDSSAFFKVVTGEGRKEPTGPVNSSFVPSS